MGPSLMQLQVLVVALALVAVPSQAKPSLLHGDSHHEHHDHAGHDHHGHHDDQEHEYSVNHGHSSDLSQQLQLPERQQLTQRIVNQVGRRGQEQEQTQSQLSSHQDQGTIGQSYSLPDISRPSAEVQQSTAQGTAPSPSHQQHQYSNNPFFSDNSLHIQQSFVPPKTPVVQQQQQQKPQQEIRPEDLNTHPLGGPAGPLGPITDQCPGPQWALPCVVRAECDPFTGFVKADGVSLPTPPHRDTPTVALGRCKLPNGAVGVCCKRLPPAKATAAPSVSGQNSQSHGNVNVFLPEYTGHKQEQGGSSQQGGSLHQQGFQGQGQPASNVNVFLPEYTNHKQQQQQQQQHGQSQVHNTGIFLPGEQQNQGQSQTYSNGGFVSEQQQQQQSHGQSQTHSTGGLFSSEQQQSHGQSQTHSTGGLFSSEQQQSHGQSQTHSSGGLFVSNQQYKQQNFQQNHRQEHFVSEQGSNVFVSQQKEHKQQSKHSQAAKEASTVKEFSEPNQQGQNQMGGHHQQQQHHIEKDGYEQSVGKIQPRHLRGQYHF